MPSSLGIFGAFSLSMLAAGYANDAFGAGEKPVAVLTVHTTDAFDQADGLTAALKRAITQTPGFTLADGEFPSVDVLIMSLGCGPDPESPPEVPDAACEEKIADQIKQERFVWAQLSKDGASVKGDVHFFQRGKRTGSAPLDYTANLTSGADDTLIQLSKDALLLAGGGAPTVRLRIEAGMENGEAFIDGVSIGKIIVGKGDLETTAGHHKLVVKLPDGRHMESEIDVLPTGETKVSLTPPAPPSKPLDGKIPAGFVLIGAGLAFAGGGLYGSLAVKNDQEQFDTTFRSIVPKGANGCENPPHPDLKVLCDDSAQHKLLQEVFYPIGGAFAITGVILLGVSDWSSKPKQKTGWEVVPVVGPGFAFVNAGARF